MAEPPTATGGNLRRLVEDPRPGGPIQEARLLRGKVRLSVLLWGGAGLAALLAQLLFGAPDGPTATLGWALVALCASVAVVRLRRLTLVPAQVPDVALETGGLRDIQSGAGLIPWAEIEGVMLDKRRNRGALSALVLLRLRDPDRFAGELLLGRRLASLALWPRIGRHHYVDASELDCRPEALADSIAAAAGLGAAERRR